MLSLNIFYTYLTSLVTMASKSHLHHISCGTQHHTVWKNFDLCWTAVKINIKALNTLQ